MALALPHGEQKSSGGNFGLSLLKQRVIHERHLENEAGQRQRLHGNRSDFTVTTEEAVR